MNIQLFKFTTGEEVVFEVIKQDDTSVTVKNGLTMVWNGQNITAIPFSVNIQDSQELTFSLDKIIFQTEPRKDLQDQYKQQFSSIITPPTSIIT